MDINVIDLSANTPLHCAAEAAHWSVLECLVGWGAALDSVNRNGHTPLHIVTGGKRSVTPESPQLKQVS